MSVLSTSQILALITNFIKAKNPQVDIQQGTDVYDIVFTSQATAVRALFEAIQTLQNNQAITTTTGKDLDLSAKKYNVTRRPATYATGQVAFFATDFSSDVFIPVNTIVSTKGNNVTPPITFLTTQSVGMSLANKSIYFDSTALRYQVKANVISASPGIGSNVDAQILSQMVSAVSGTQGVINDNPITGGTDQETDISVQQRCLQAFVVGSVGTLYGYRKLLTDNFNEVLDVHAVGPFDAGSVRPTGVDIFTLLSEATITGNELQTTESFTYNISDTGYTPVNRPVISIDAVDGTALGVVRAFIPYPLANADFQFIKDTTGANAMSVQSADRINWLSLGIKPDSGSKVFITYTYNNEVQVLQNWMDEDANKVVGASALVKIGSSASVSLSLTVVLFPTADPSSARAKVSAAVNQYLNSFLFGEALEMSDLLLVAQLGTFTDFVISEVDFIIFDPTLITAYVADTGQTLTMSGDRLVVGVNQYIRPSVVTIS
jgi:uncharacterized phage protein gp47/JayE